MKKIIVLIYLLFWYSICISQNYTANNFSFINYTTQNGLCGNEVVKTIKDKNGFLWIATHNGLSRFDGKKFTTYTYLPNDSTSLRSIWITDILLDNKNILWLSTEWGICWYDEKYDRFRYINKKDELIILYKAPMVLGNDDLIWAACENGLFKINTIKKDFERTSLNRISDPVCINIDFNKNIWIGTRANGLIKYNSNQNKSVQIKSNIIPANTDLLGSIRDKNSIWFSTSEGLLQVSDNNTLKLFNNGEGDLLNKNIKQLTSIEYFDSINFICGTYDNKLLLFNKISQKFTYQWKDDKNLPKAICNYILKDKDYYWICTHAGLCKMQNSVNGINYTALNIEGDKLNFQKVLNDNVNKDFVWLLNGGVNPKLIKYDNVKNIIRKSINCKSSTNSNYNKTSMLQVEDGSIFTFVNKFINVFSNDGEWKKEINCTELILSSYLENENSIWLGTENGIANFIVKTNSLQYFPLSFNGTDIENKSLPQKFPTYGITIDKNGIIWLSNLKHGLFSFDRNTKSLTAHRQPSNLSYETLNRCSSITINNDTVWLGTMSGISSYAIKQNKFDNYNLSNGLANTYVYNISKGLDNNFWGRGNAGVFKFDLRSKKIKNFKLPSNFDNFYFMQQVSADSGKCYLGLENGFAIINDYTSDNKNLEIFITSKLVNGKRIFEENKFENLKHFENNIQFDFTTINFNDESIVYSYMLEGLNENWIDVNSKDNLLFTNLPAGEYLFKVKAKRLRDNIFGNETTFKFTVHAAFWQTWWFKFLVALFLVILLISFAHWRIKSIRKKESEKTEINKMMSQLETKLLRSQMNPHFIFNSLNSIQKFIWENKEEEAAEYLSSFAKLIRAILENSRKDFINLADEIKILKLYIDLEQRRSNNKFDYSFEINENLALNDIEVPPLLLQPFIENAIWHGLNKKSEKGHLKIKIEQISNQIKYTVDDNGVGQSNAKINTIPLKESLGIDITKQRIILLVNNISADDYLKITDKFENGIPMGTKVEIILPIKYANA